MGQRSTDMQSLESGLYPAAIGPLEVRTPDPLKLFDPIQQRDVTLRVNMPLGAGPWPVIVFSHGSLCGFTQYNRLTSRWASRGYITIMPCHLDALEAEAPAGPPDLQKLLTSRVRDMSFVLDALGELSDQIGVSDLFDEQKIVAAGHSFGALTAIIKLGLALRPGEYLLDGDVRDDRFCAGINMSGVGPLPPMTDDAFDHLTAPLLVTGGTLDEGNVGAGPVFPWEWRMSAYTLAPAGDKYSLVLNDGDHYLGGLIARDDRGGAADPDGVDILAAVTTAFLDAYVRDSAPAREWLSHADLPGLPGGRVKFETK